MTIVWLFLYLGIGLGLAAALDEKLDGVTILFILLWPVFVVACVLMKVIKKVAA